MRSSLLKKKRVLVLLHPEVMPPDEASANVLKGAEWRGEYHVVSNLRGLGHEVETLGVIHDLSKIRERLYLFKPNIVFNLLEEFAEKSIYDQNIVSYLQLAKMPFTGNTPRGLILGRDKALSKKVLMYHRIPVPSFQVFPKGRKIRPRKNLQYPFIVKSLTEEASLGISQASVVHDEAKLIERIAFIHESVQTAAIAERYIEGREIYVGMLGNRRVKIFTPWELTMGQPPKGAPQIATASVKHSLRFQKRYKVKTGEAKGLPPEVLAKIQKICKRTYRALHLSGYARIDIRLTDEGVPYVLEANPNPDLSEDEDFALAAKHDGIKYAKVLDLILRSGLDRKDDTF